MLITMLWHIHDEFYNVRIPKGMKTISSSTMRMRSKIYHVEVNWKYHVILTLDERNVEKYRNKIDSTMLRTYLTKLRKIFPNEKHFWKYEQGRKSERPHFHLLFDLEGKVRSKMKEIVKVMDIENVGDFVKTQRKYGMNNDKSDLEITMGYFMFKLWNKGIAHVRYIKNEIDLLQQVERDVAKRTGTEGFRKNKQKFGFSRGLKMIKVVKKSEYEWAGNCNVNDALCYLDETKENFIEHFDKGDYSGEIIFEYTVEDLKKVEKENKIEAGLDIKQVRLSEFK